MTGWTAPYWKSCSDGRDSESIGHILWGILRSPLILLVHLASCALFWFLCGLLCLRKQNLSLYSRGLVKKLYCGLPCVEQYTHTCIWEINIYKIYGRYEMFIYIWNTYRDMEYEYICIYISCNMMSPTGCPLFFHEMLCRDFEAFISSLEETPGLFLPD